MGRTTYRQMREILRSLEPRYGYIIEPWEEQETIDFYNNPGRLRDRFRSQAIDRILRWENVVSEDTKKWL